MALRVVSMAELRLEVLLEPERTGESVASVCRRNGISRETYYRYRRRYLAEGARGLADRSKRPASSPAKIDPQLEREICRMRTDHPRWGARRIAAELSRSGVDPPAVSTIHQALRRNHLVADHPPKRKKALHRFEREVSNDLWQIDATAVRLASRHKVWVMDTIDDHSRYLLAAVGAEGPTVEAAWDCFEEAASRYWLPRQVLSDNGTCFTGRLQGFQVGFERNLAELGVELINSGPYHPQTLGKLERFHRTLKAWLSDQGPAEDLAHLQELLDGFRFHYNRERPHQGIGDATPAERFGLAPAPLRPPGSGVVVEVSEPTYPEGAILRRVSSSGDLAYRGLVINVGRRWARGLVHVVEHDGQVSMFWEKELIRSLVLDPSKHRQGWLRREGLAQTVR